MRTNENSWRWNLGTILVLDKGKRTIIEVAEIFVPIEEARRTLKRMPDVETENVISWGNLVLTECMRLIETVDDLEERGMCAAEIERLFKSQSPDGVLFSIHYGDIYGQ